MSARSVPSEICIFHKILQRLRAPYCSKVSGTQWWGHYIKCGFQVVRGSPPLRPYPDDEDDEIADAQVEDGGENGEVSPLPTTVAV